MTGSLSGCNVLVVEDEPLIALDIADCFKLAGADVVVAATLEAAMRYVETPRLTAAVIDHTLHDGLTSADVCKRLNDLNIPFVLYSGFGPVTGPCANGEHISKPAYVEKVPRGGQTGSGPSVVAEPLALLGASFAAPCFRRRSLSKYASCSDLRCAASMARATRGCLSLSGHRMGMAEKDAPVLARMSELAAQYPHYGYRRIRIFLGRDGHKMSFVRAYRLWKTARCRASGLASALPAAGRVRRRRLGQTRCGATTSCSTGAPTARS